MKKLLVAIAVLMFAVPAFAILPAAWVGDGFREVGASNSSVVTYTPYRTPRQATEQDCNDYIAEANLIAPGVNVKGAALLTKIHAKCVQTEFAD